MMNWLFTWLRPDGPLTHEAMSEVVADLFFGGLQAVRAPRPRVSRTNKRAGAATATLAAAPISTPEGDTL
jgi:hypothetical protein